MSFFPHSSYLLTNMVMQPVDLTSSSEKAIDVLDRVKRNKRVKFLRLFVSRLHEKIFVVNVLLVEVRSTIF